MVLHEEKLHEPIGSDSGNKRNKKTCRTFCSAPTSEQENYNVGRSST